MVLLLTTTLIIGFINLLLFHVRKRVESEASEAWRILCRKLSNVGLPRRPDQGPIDFLEYIIANRPDLTQQVSEIVSVYIQIRYRSHAKKETMLLLKTLVNKFSPGKMQQHN